MKKVKVKIDGGLVTAETGQSIIQVAAKMGISIPSLCYFEGLKPYGSCRLCVVKVREKGDWRVVTACNYPVKDGIEVLTEDGFIRSLRKRIIMLHLSYAPLSNAVRKLAEQYEVEEPDEAGLKVDSTWNMCILCGLCARVCDEVVGACAIDFSGRGRGRKLSLPFDEVNLDACTGCGACSFVCPSNCINLQDMKVRFMREQWSSGYVRMCRYALAGLLPSAVCDNDYRCQYCAIEIRMKEMSGELHPVFLKRKLSSVR